MPNMPNDEAQYQQYITYLLDPKPENIPDMFGGSPQEKQGFKRTIAHFEVKKRPKAGTEMDEEEEEDIILFIKMKDGISREVASHWSKEQKNAKICHVHVTHPCVTCSSKHYTL